MKVLDLKKILATVVKKLQKNRQGVDSARYILIQYGINKLTEEGAVAANFSYFLGALYAQITVFWLENKSLEETTYWKALMDAIKDIQFGLQLGYELKTKNR